MLFPRVFASGEAKAEFSLLGLGDIVVPGLFVSLLLRFDAVRAKVNAIKAEHALFSKPYFHANIVGYALGLVLTVAIMYYFKAAQVSFHNSELQNPQVNPLLYSPPFGSRLCCTWLPRVWALRYS